MIQYQWSEETRLAENSPEFRNLNKLKYILNPRNQNNQLVSFCFVIIKVYTIFFTQDLSIC